MNPRIAVVTATRFYPPQLTDLVRRAHREDADVIIVPDVFDRGADWSLYRLWNAGLRIAVETFGAQFVAIVNDDAELYPGSFTLMRDALASRQEFGVVYPNTSRPYDRGIGPESDLISTQGTWAGDGMTGFCFMVNTGRVPFGFDEAYRWWYGDDAFEERVRGLGLKVGRVVALPIRHTPNGSASRAMTALRPMISADRDLWDARHQIDRLGPSKTTTEAVPS